MLTYSNMQRQTDKIGRSRTRKIIPPLFVRRLSPSTAARLPSYGFFVGLVLGLAISMVRSIKNIAGLLVMVVS